MEIFFVAAMEKYKFDKQYDIIFSFASLLHSDKKNVEKIINIAADSLSDKGIFFILLKMKNKYKIEVKKDQFGERTFYFYPPKMIEQFAKKFYKIIFINKYKKGKTDWFSILLQKK